MLAAALTVPASALGAPTYGHEIGSTTLALDAVLKDTNGKSAEATILAAIGQDNSGWIRIRICPNGESCVDYSDTLVYSDAPTQTARLWWDNYDWFIQGDVDGLGYVDAAMTTVFLGGTCTSFNQFTSTFYAMFPEVSDRERAEIGQYQTNRWGPWSPNGSRGGRNCAGFDMTLAWAWN